MYPIQFCDQLVFSREGLGVQLTCSDASLPTDERNLVHRAATSFLQATGITDGLRIHLEKKIPQAAGLGGGSGNAATTLLGLNELFGQPLAAEKLAGVGGARWGRHSVLFTNEAGAGDGARGKIYFVRTIFRQCTGRCFC